MSGAGPNGEGLPVTPPRHNYPLPTNIVTEDGRCWPELFTAGVWIDVLQVLRQHGYPEPTGADLVDLQMALWEFLYGRLKEDDAAG